MRDELCNLGILGRQRLKAREFKQWVSAITTFSKDDAVKVKLEQLAKFGALHLKHWAHLENNTTAQFTQGKAYQMPQVVPQRLL